MSKHDDDYDRSEEIFKNLPEDLQQQIVSKSKMFMDVGMRVSYLANVAMGDNGMGIEPLGGINESGMSSCVVFVIGHPKIYAAVKTACIEATTKLSAEPGSTCEALTEESFKDLETVI